MKFSEACAPTAQQASMRVLLAHSGGSAEHGPKLPQFDVATAFLES